MKLIFLHGLPGVGKLTVARELAVITGYKLFHNHLTVDLVTSIFEFGREPFVELREKIWLEAFAQAGKAGLSGLIFTFAPEATVRESFIPEAQSRVEANGGEVLFVELTCSLEELEKRLTSASRRDFGKLDSLELFRELSTAGTFDNPRIPPSVLTLDITSLSADEAAEIIANKLDL
jgi:AAA domain